MKKSIGSIIAIASVLCGILQIPITVSATSAVTQGNHVPLKLNRSIALSHIASTSNLQITFFVFIVIAVTAIIFAFLLKACQNENKKRIEVLSKALEFSENNVKQLKLELNYLEHGINCLKETNQELSSNVYKMSQELDLSKAEYEFISSRYQTLNDRYKRITLLYPSADYEVTEMIKSEKARNEEKEKNKEIPKKEETKAELETSSVTSPNEQDSQPEEKTTKKFIYITSGNGKTISSHIKIRNFSESFSKEQQRNKVTRDMALMYTLINYERELRASKEKENQDNILEILKTHSDMLTRQSHNNQYKSYMAYYKSSMPIIPKHTRRVATRNL